MAIQQYTAKYEGYLSSQLLWFRQYLTDINYYLHSSPTAFKWRNWLKQIGRTISFPNPMTIQGRLDYEAAAITIPKVDINLNNFSVRSHLMLHLIRYYHYVDSSISPSHIAAELFFQFADKDKIPFGISNKDAARRAIVFWLSELFLIHTLNLEQDWQALEIPPILLNAHHDLITQEWNPEAKFGLPLQGHKNWFNYSYSDLEDAAANKNERNWFFFVSGIIVDALALLSINPIIAWGTVQLSMEERYAINASNPNWMFEADKEAGITPDEQSAWNPPKYFGFGQSRHFRR